MTVSNPPHKTHVTHVSQPDRAAKKHSSGKKTAYPTLHQWFEAQAENTPDAVAISFGTKQLTYRELNEKANQLANYLRTMEVGPETLVGMFVERSLELVVGILGILKAGGAYVPFDLAYPKDRLSFMFEDANIQVLLTQKKLLADLSDVGNEQPSLTLPKTICLDDDWSIISKGSSGNPKSGATGNNLAYVIYTSGTTGKPKGVLVTHANVVRLFESTEHWFHFGPFDVWTLFHSYAFDFSVWEIWGALLYGGRLVIVNYLMTRSPEDFFELLSREKVTVLNQTPSAFRQLIWADASAEIKRQLHLRYVIFGGEALDLQILMPWFERRGDTQPQLINMYGITETTVHVTYRPIALRDVIEGVGSVIGEPIPDLQIHLLDKKLDLVADGCEGEIYVGGAGVGRGYLNRPELTSERFIINPFSESAEDRLYKTGDLARRLPNGDMEYLGRLDEQIKIRGFRIELGEISSVLNSHPSVRESVVIVDQVASGDNRLIAYVVVDQTIPSITELRQSLKQQLPDYMLPAAFIFLDKMPLTPNGKLDRYALPHLDGARPELKNAFFAPNKSKEKVLAEIWSDVLQIKPVGIHDNFFELGGDSIRSIQVIARARQEGLNITLEQLFQEQTIYNLVQWLMKSTDRVNNAEPVQPFGMISSEDKKRLPDGLEDAYPIIQLQIGMLYHGELNPESGLYHDIFSYCIEASFYYDKFETAVRQLVECHAILRTSFDLDQYGEPLQLVHRHLETVPLALEDLRDMSPSEQDDVISAWIEEEKVKPFDHTVAPLLRFHIHWLGDQTFQLSYASHHAILDGWSLAAMLTELLQTYKNLLHPHKKSFAQPVPPPYRNYVTLEKETLKSDKCREFWTQKLINYQVLKLPRWPGVNRLGADDELLIRYVPLSTALSDGLKQLANRVGVPIKSVLLAAHVFVLSYLNGQNDVLTGLVTNGRPEEIDAERTLGLFLNTVPFRVHLHGGTWKQLVKEVFETEQELLPFRRYPLSEIQKNAGGESLFETPFLMVHFHVYKELLGENRIKFTEGPFFEYTNFPFFAFFSIDPVTQKAQLRFDLNAGQFCEEQIQELAGYYINTLTAMVDHPEGRYEIFSPLSDSEMHRLLYEWNDTHVDYPDGGLHELVEAQVERTPDSVAVLFEDKTLTYAELDAYANQLANHLIQQAVGTGSLVGICMERSLEMVICLLGVLKTGAGYVPLDPDYPDARLNYIIQDAGVHVILTYNHGSQLPAGKKICLDEDWEIINQASRKKPIVRVQQEDTAYVLYTSGSTGAPKGVIIPHRAICNHMLWMQRVFPLMASDSVLQKTPFGFDASVWEFYAPLMVGGRLVMARPGGHQDSVYLINTLQLEGITTLQLVPSMLPTLLNERKFSDCKSLRRLFCGGEDLSQNLQQRFFDCLSSAQMYNLYGPTETTIDATFWKCRHEKGQTSVPLGRPIDNVQTYIVDNQMRPVPAAVPGELLIGGAGVGTGYANLPDLTAERFIPHPFSNQPGQRVFRTGDLARYRPDGVVEFLGRTDHQVKLRGFRIELGEIEAVLGRHPEVKSAVVVVREDTPGEKRLVAYAVVTTPTDAPSGKVLRDFLKKKLPNYMLPAEFVVLDAMPLMPSGKVDRRALPMPDDSKRSYEEAYVAPQTPTEKALAAIWTEILNIDKIGIHDDFFELGGHSLLAIQVASRIRKRFNVTFSLRHLFESSTLAGQALEIDQNQVGKGKHDELTILLNKIENLQDEEAERLLLEEMETGEDGL